jgi:predicted transcriptional regulator of viral defense system
MSTKRPASEAEREVIRHFRKHGVQRTRDLETLGASRQYLGNLVARGVIMRVQRGLYALPNGDMSEHRSIVEVCKRVPKGVVCLLSALRFHDLTTQLPSQVWMAIDVKARQPIAKSIPIKFVRFSGKALSAGVKTHRIEGVPVQVYSPAKTVADCFKYRNKIGMDVALEALRDFRRQQKADMDALWKYAKICRVANVMRPYLESLA